MPITTKTINLYSYDCLPTDEAKANARDWWRILESQDPSWHAEHEKSREEACQALQRMLEEGGTIDEDEKQTLIEVSGNLELTGYHADYLLADYLREYCAPYSVEQLSNFYCVEWEGELSARLEDVGGIEETLLVNDYTFTETGDRAD